MIGPVRVAPLKRLNHGRELLAILGKRRVRGNFGNKLMAQLFGVGHLVAILLVCNGIEGIEAVRNGEQEVFTCGLELFQSKIGQTNLRRNLPLLLRTKDTMSNEMM
jgi:hypothetical protein